MAGGSFDLTTAKVRPGTYINFVGETMGAVGAAERGTVLLPLFEHDYGPSNAFISVTNVNPDVAMSKLGYSVFDAENRAMRMIREALKNASEVLVYLPQSGEIAQVTAGNLTVKARYGGSRGNSFKLVIQSANEADKYNVLVYLDNRLVYEGRGLSSVEDLLAEKESEWLVFEGEGVLSEVAGIHLEGGEDSLLAFGSMSEFFADCESYKWDTLAWPYSQFEEDVAAKIRYLRDEAGIYRKAVCANFAAGYEGLINVTNSVVLSDGTVLSTEEVTAWVAGADAGAAATDSLTYKEYVGAVGLVGAKEHRQAVEAIEKGEFFFSVSDDGRVVVEYDINSLVDFKDKNESYRKNRVLRVLDSLAGSIRLTFLPNKYDNSPVGWDIMEGVGKTLLRQFEDAGAIANVDYDEDFRVDRLVSKGDSTFFNVGIQTVDSAEKLYFEIRTI